VATVLIAQLAQAAEPARADAQVASQWRWSGVERVVAVGDVHGAYSELVEVLGECGLIDDDQIWSGGSAHLVMLGDLVDRGAQSREALTLVMRLQAEARNAGGQVHFVLGNHEVMNLVGNLAYTSPEEFAAFAVEEDDKQRKHALKRTVQSSLARNGDLRKMRQVFEKRYPRGYFGHRQAFSPDGLYGRWLLDQHVVVVINDVAFIHGGLSPMLLDLAPDEINAVAMGELRTFVASQQRLMELGVLGPEMPYGDQISRVQAIADGSEAKGRTDEERDLAATMFDLGEAMVFRRDGPLWYRGTSLNPADEEGPIVDRVLAHLGASSVVVGHTPVHTGRLTTRFDGEVVLADTGMLASHYGGRGAAVEIRNGRLFSLYPGEGASPLSDQRWELTEDLFAGDADLEEFLRTAQVVWIEDVGSGTTEPMQVGLADNGRRAKAIFKVIDTDGRRFVHEVAAYRLDRLLGLGMVPPTVLREVDGIAGSLQLWVENAISEGDRRDENLQPADAEAFKAELDAAGVFDLVIFNIDRNGSNMLITPDDWSVHLIDHERSFASRVPSEPHLVDARSRLDSGLSQRLGQLDGDAVRSALDGLLSDDQISALLTRVDLVLSGS
jgi:hypothetical protein